MAFGTTHDTISHSRCGFDGVSDLLPFDHRLQVGAQYMEFLRKRLIDMGYISGLTAQAIPYDFRLSYKSNRIPKIWGGIVDDLYSMTGKKVSILSHSMGGYEAYHNLMLMSQKDKDLKIYNWFSIGTPFAGSSDMSKILLGLEDFKVFLNLKIGSVGTLISNFNASYELMPRDTWNRNKDLPWMKELAQRAETGSSTNTGGKPSALDIFPESSEICSEVKFNPRPLTCDMGFTPYNLFATINNEEITAAKLESTLKNTSPYEFADQFYAMAQDERFTTMVNPGVQTNILYGSHLETEYRFKFEGDIKNEFKN